MDMKDIMPWKRWHHGEGEQEPFYAMQRRMNEMFDDLFNRLPSLGWPGERSRWSQPRVNVTQKNGTVIVEAEVPGMEEKDIDVSVTDDVLTISGEKHEEREEQGEEVLRREFAYGSFRRTVSLPHRVVAENAKATFRRGLLHIELPVSPEERERTRKIAVSSE